MREAREETDKTTETDKTRGKTSMTLKASLLASAGAAAVMALAAPAARAEGPVVKIGIAAALTGDFAPYSESAGARCMADTLNKAAGPDDPKIDLVIEDNRSDAQLSVSLGQKFVDDGAAVIAGVPFPDALIPMAQMAAPAGVTVYSAPNSQVEMHEVGLDNFIAGAVPDPMNAAATAEAVAKAGGRNAVLLTSEDSGSWSAKTPEWFGEALAQHGGKVVGRLNYAFGTTDWSPQIADIKALAEKPDIVYVCAMVPDVGILVRQLRSNGYEGFVVGCDGFDDPSFAETVGNPAFLDKVMFATHGVMGDGGRIDAFLASCKAAGYKVNGIFDALGADMVAVVYDAAKAAGTNDPTALREAIRASDGFKTVTSDKLSFKEKREYPVKTIPVIGYRDGKRVVIADVVPGFIPYLK